jgi:hypothetical protein
MGRLGLTQSLAAQLMVSELAGDLAQEVEASSGLDKGTWVIRAGNRLFMPRVGLDVLDRVPEAREESVSYINVRLGPGTQEDGHDSRRYLGFHRRFTARERYDAATRWWLFKRASEWIDRPFVASIAGFVTLAGRIDGVSSCPSTGAVSFDVDLDDERIRSTFSGRRIPIHQGGPALKVVH